jgi:CRP-like cAMP-binding protein
MTTIYPVELRNYLDQFYQLSDQEYELFSSYFDVVHYRPKQKLIDEGEQEYFIYYVVKGIFRKYFHREKAEVVTAFFKENDICHSVVSFFTGIPSNVVIEAIEPSVCVRIRRHDLEFLFTQIPGLEKIFRNVLVNLYVKKDIDQMNNLRYSKKERFLLFCDQSPELLQRVPQKHLASYLEMAAETFCRMKHVRYEMARKKMNEAC